MSAAQVAQLKKDQVKELVTLLDEYPIIGVVDVENLPTKQFQTMRANLREKVVIKIAKRRLIQIALEQSKNKDVKKLEVYLTGMPGLIFTRENPFKLFKTLKDNKSKAPAKAGNIAPSDITVKAGPTSFAPGPIIAQLGALQIKAGIEGGKVAIKEDSIVAKEGDVIDAQLAEILARLDINPMEIGLNITAILEEGSIFTKEVLDVDEQAYLNNIALASAESTNLAYQIGYLCAETTPGILAKAFLEAKALAMTSDILADAVAEDLLVKAHNQALTLQATMSGEAPKEQVAQSDAPKEEKPKEEVKEEEAPDAAAGLGALFG
ncbi:50S ribosomal protein L10 [Candidatus Woesearchaeota archaeon]|nr:50S ribosomal protein L10 [Candidatus Woesearchaeota archaeon]